MGLSQTEQRGMLSETFERQAEWRRQKVGEFPDDLRNAEAAAILEKLAGTVGSVPGDVLSAYYDLFDDVSDTAIEAEMLQRVGFQYTPDTAEDFVRAFIAERTG
jgi:hypothetical protein